MYCSRDIATLYGVFGIKNIENNDNFVILPCKHLGGNHQFNIPSEKNYQNDYLFNKSLLIT